MISILFMSPWQTCSLWITLNSDLWAPLHGHGRSYYLHHTWMTFKWSTEHKTSSILEHMLQAECKNYAPRLWPDDRVKWGSYLSPIALHVFTCAHHSTHIHPHTHVELAKSYVTRRTMWVAVKPDSDITEKRSGSKSHEHASFRRVACWLKWLTSSACKGKSWVWSKIR